MSHRSNIRKRERQQKKRHLQQRPQPVDKPIARVRTAGLFGAVLERSRGAFDEALKEVQLAAH
jgi:hypothetical protein